MKDKVISKNSVAYLIKKGFKNFLVAKPYYLGDMLRISFSKFSSRREAINYMERLEVTEGLGR